MKTSDDILSGVATEVIPLGDASWQRKKLYYGFLQNYASIHTRKNYAKDLATFLEFLKRFFPGVMEVEIDHDHMVAYKEFLVKNGGERKEEFAPRTINRKLASLGAFYEHLFMKGIVKENPMRRVKRFTIKREVVTGDLSDDQVKALLSSVDLKAESGPLHQAILSLFFSTGMRHGELANLKLGNLVYEGEFLVLKYQGKGQKEMVTPLNEKVREDLGRYLGYCQENGYSMEEGDFIFRPTKNPAGGNLNKKLDTKAMGYIFKKYAKKIGFKGKVSVHSARSTVIGMLLDKGISIDRVAEFVGHSDIGTTKNYNKRKSQMGKSLAFEIDI